MPANACVRTELMQNVLSLIRILYFLHTSPLRMGLNFRENKTYLIFLVLYESRSC